MHPRTSHTGEAAPAWAMFGTWMLTVLVSAGCTPGPDDSECKPACDSPYQCDSEAGSCRPTALSEADLPPPGRGLAATNLDGTPYISALHPSENLVVAGAASDDQSLKIVGEVDVSADTDTAIDANENSNVVAVGWRDTDDSYRVASRTTEGWRRSVRVEAESSYAATDDFDLAVDPSGEIHLVFRDGDKGTLRYLAPADDRGWTATVVDAGATVPTRADCASNEPDLGRNPDAEFLAPTLSSQLSVSYYDASCGDLRLAQRTGETWTVRVVDRGTFAIPAGDESIRRTGDVGRYSAIAARSNGSVAIAYHDVRRGGLAFASERDGTFRTALIDPGLEGGRKQFRGAFADLGFDADGTPHIAYFDGTAARLRLASRRAGAEGWILRPIGRTSPAGFHSRLVVLEDRLLLLAEQFETSNGTYRSRLFQSTVELR